MQKEVDNLRKKRLVKIGAVAVAFVLLVSFVYLIESSVDYWLQTYSYRVVDNKWVSIYGDTTYNQTFTTVHCQNRGLLEASYTFTVTFRNANVTINPNQPYQIIGGTTAKITQNLMAQEKSDTNVYFSLDSITSNFTISITIQANQFFMRSQIPGMYPQDTVYYDQISNGTFGAAMIA
jgi:hypothetical protein